MLIWVANKDVEPLSAEILLLLEAAEAWDPSFKAPILGHLFEGLKKELRRKDE